MRPNVAEDFAHAHNAGLWQCLKDILGVSPDQCDRLSRDASSLPLSVGGLGLRNAVRTGVPAFWASWADPLQMVHERHPVIGLKQRALDGVLSAEVHAFQTMKQWKWSLAQCGEVDNLSC